MLNIRQGVFETNSSSTHSITVTTASNYRAWLRGELRFNELTEEFVSKPPLPEHLKQQCQEHYESTKQPHFKDWDELTEEAKSQLYEIYARAYSPDDRSFLTHPEWKTQHYGCQFSEVFYTTEHGDEIVAFGYGGEG